MFTGSLVAIVTPFRNGKLDERVFGDLIEWQIANGTNGIVPCGTTGESATLTHDEHHRVIKLAVEVAKRRVPVIAGTGSNSTDEAISLTKHAKEDGAEGAQEVAQGGDCDDLGRRLRRRLPGREVALEKGGIGIAVGKRRRTDHIQQKLAIGGDAKRHVLA